MASARFSRNQAVEVGRIILPAEALREGRVPNAPVCQGWWDGGLGITRHTIRNKRRKDSPTLSPRVCPSAARRVRAAASIRSRTLALVEAMGFHGKPTTNRRFRQACRKADNIQRVIARDRELPCTTVPQNPRGLSRSDADEPRSPSYRHETYGKQCRKPPCRRFLLCHREQARFLQLHGVG